MLGRKKKTEMWSPSSHSGKWDEEERRYKETSHGNKKYPKHEWGYDLGRKKKKSLVDRLKER
ncbi:MAG: hypothetical protein JRN06_06365 [Nitrososphaerota archaeon]|nr:hypothetical protein [Nitrososphaerota archaeon]